MESVDLSRFYWTKNRKLTEDDAFLITTLFYLSSPTRYIDYTASFFNYPSSYIVHKQSLGWNIRRVFDWKHAEPEKIDLFDFYGLVAKRYNISDWLDSAFQEAISGYASFFKKVTYTINYEDGGALTSFVDEYSSQWADSMHKSLKTIRSEWVDFKNKYQYLRSDCLDEFIDFSLATTKLVRGNKNKMSDFYLWKSVIFAAKSRRMAATKNYDHSFLWCHRSLEEYLKALVVKMHGSQFREDKCWWNGEPVIGVMKYLNIVQREVAEVYLFDKLENLKKHILMRNSSVIGHGSQMVTKKASEEFIYDFVGMVNTFDQSGNMRFSWLDRVKCIESINNGELLRLLSYMVIEKSGIICLTDITE